MAEGLAVGDDLSQYKNGDFQQALSKLFAEKCRDTRATIQPTEFVEEFQKYMTSKIQSMNLETLEEMTKALFIFLRSKSDDIDDVMRSFNETD